MKKKLIIFGTGQIAEEVFNYFEKDSDYKVEAFTVDDSFFKKKTCDPENLQNILPCKYCRDNIVKNMEKIPLTMKVFKNRENLSKWVYELHEIVNKMLNKVSGLSYEDVRQRYETFRARCIEKETKINKNLEKGCTEPLYGSKAQCILNIVPKDARKKSLTIDSHCILKKK